MSLPVRIAHVVVGLVVTVYGTASITGGWLGTPPWWERERVATLADEVIEQLEARGGTAQAVSCWSVGNPPSTRYFKLRDGREWISGGVVAAGTGLAASGAWPRRRRRPTTTT